MSTENESNGAGGRTPTFASIASELRRPLAPRSVKFKIQTVSGSRAQVVTYQDARSVTSMLNRQAPGAWEATTQPPDPRLLPVDDSGQPLTRVNRYGQPDPNGDPVIYAECTLVICGARFTDVGSGKDPKSCYSDALKRAAVRAGIGEYLYAAPAPWLAVGTAEHELPSSQNGKPYLNASVRKHLRELYEQWLEREGKTSFGEPVDLGEDFEAVGEGDAGDSAAAGGNNGNGAQQRAARPAAAQANGNARQLVGKATDRQIQAFEKIAKERNLTDERVATLMSRALGRGNVAADVATTAIPGLKQELTKAAASQILDFLIKGAPNGNGANGNGTATPDNAAATARAASEEAAAEGGVPFQLSQVGA
jgi:hypothetical protein